MRPFWKNACQKGRCVILTNPDGRLGLCRAAMSCGLSVSIVFHTLAYPDMANKIMMVKKQNDCGSVMPMLLAVLLSMLHFFDASAESDNARWVDPMIGTGFCDAATLWGNYGGTYPGAVAPWGMVQLTPETSERPTERGYFYSDNSILCFTCLGHNSGYPDGSAGHLALTFLRGRCADMPLHYSGRRYLHDDECAKPGYYGVRFVDGDEVAMTAATNAGIVVYKSACKDFTLVVCRAGAVSVRSRREVHCSVANAVLTFSQPMRKYEMRGDTLYAQFSTTKPLKVMLSVSMTSLERSRENGAKQLAGGDFDAVKDWTYGEWCKELSCVDVDDDDERIKKIFYTALYHAMLMPCNVADVGRTPRYAGFSPWDTFRTLHPLLSLLKPDVQNHMVNCMIDEYRHRGMLPNGPMSGYHVLPILLDSYVKGAAKCAVEDICDAGVRSYAKVMCSPGNQKYVKKGYFDAMYEQSVSKTADYAYDDWAMMRLCQLANRYADAEKYGNRARNYANLWDVSTMFLTPRDGEQWLRQSGELGYQESNKYTASLFAPHNMRHLVNLSGGERNFVNRLSAAFSDGKVVFDNEPVFHYPWAFVWGRRPDLAMRQVREIVDKSFSDTPGGLPGNDDLGSMSSWVAFAIMGIMPVCPGTDQYVSLPPVAKRVTIHMPNGRDMTISGGGDAAPDAQMPIPKLNGRCLRRCHVTHDELLGGGELSYEWRCDAEDLDLPYSLDGEDAQFAVKMLLGKNTQTIVTNPDKECVMPFSVSNRGADGAYVATLTCDGRTAASKNVFVPAGTCVSDTLRYRLYPLGRHRLMLGSQQCEAVVEDSDAGSEQLRCTNIRLQPAVRNGKQTVEVAMMIKNVSGTMCNDSVPVLVDGVCCKKLGVEINPGEAEMYELNLPLVTEKGVHSVSVLNCTEKMKVYADALDATVLDVDYSDGKAIDKSGFGNDGICRGQLVWNDGCVTTAKNAYVEFPVSASIMYPYQQFTMLVWICPSGKNGGGYVDFFTKGDYTLMKIVGRNRLVFFAGGWGRGECEVTLPEDWSDRWHQVVGVCSGDSIKIYIDGQLRGSLAVKGEVSYNALPWNVGRNAEMPYSRYGEISFRVTRIYAEALSDAEIKHLYNTEKTKYSRR